MNLFNALNGEEAKQAIKDDVARVLDSDSEFRAHLTFPRVSWEITIKMNIYPRTPAEKVIEVIGEAVQVQSTHDGEIPVLARDENGMLMPVVDAEATHTRLVLRTERSAQAPDAIREEIGMQTNMAAPGGVRIARRAEVGKAALNQTINPGLNR